MALHSKLVIPSLFVEYAYSDTIAVGLDYIPMSADVSNKTKSRSDTETSVSGTAIVGEAGADGFGTILSGSLERSNVDITEELVSLITAQRNFQANAKSIETNSTITQAIINIRS